MEWSSDTAAHRSTERPSRNCPQAGSHRQQIANRVRGIENHEAQKNIKKTTKKPAKNTRFGPHVPTQQKLGKSPFLLHSSVTHSIFFFLLFLMKLAIPRSRSNESPMYSPPQSLTCDPPKNDAEASRKITWCAENHRQISRENPCPAFKKNINFPPK